MTAKQNFSEEEWKQLLQAPGAAGIYIMMADPNFVIGSMKEAFTVSCSIIEKGKQQNSELLSALLSEFKEREMAKKAQLKFEEKNLEGVKKTTLEALKKAVSILDAKADPQEATEIKSWLYDVSVKAANAAKEGGFLGFGGTRVSEKEEAALKDLAALLGVST